MKLFEKYNRLNITATILIFIIGSCSFYFLLNFILIRELDEELQSEQQEIVTFVNLHNALPEIIRTKNQSTSYTLTDKKTDPLFRSIKNSHDKEEESQRELQFTIEAGGKYYLVLVDKPLEETESLLQVIIGVTIAVIALILLACYLINRTVIRKLWKPFYRTIDQVKNYHLADTFSLENTGIEEFSLLNRSINEMIERIQHDYNSLKNFTGQAAHEMQTPLAIIRTKLDMLIQNEPLLQRNAQGITDIERGVQRLSRLHQSLLLLTKVENKQFTLNEPVDIDKIIKDKSSEYTEIMEEMHLALTLKLEPTTILFHNHLADILVNNIINNATRYNKEGGNVTLELQNKTLTISNTSPNKQLDTVKLFKPFYRDNNMQDGTGLGLSIVKQICDTAGYSIWYQYTADQHIFTITFN